MPDVRMPDGKVVRFPDTMSEQQIRGLIASRYPREVGEANSANPTQPTGHYSFDPTGIPGVDPATGMRESNDVGGAFLTGVRRAAEGAAGVMGDVNQMQGDLAAWVAGKFGASPDTQERVRSVTRRVSLLQFAPTTEQIREHVSDPLLGVAEEADTVPEQYAQTIGEFSGGVFAPGGPLRRAAMTLIPALISETAGQLTKDTPYETPARLVGALTGVGAASVPGRVAAPVRQAATELNARPSAVTALIRDMQNAGRTPDEIRDAIAKLGPEGALIDLPEFQQRGQRIYARGGEGRQTISQFLRPRAEGANQRIRATVDENLGPAPTPTQVRQELTEARQALSPEYEAAFANARRVETETIANDLRSMRANVRGRARSVIDDVLDDLKIEGTDQLDPHPRALHAVRESIDGMLSGETDSNVRRILREVRAMVDSELAAKVPGIKEVDAKYAALKRQEEAFERGITSLDSGRTTPRPSELAQEIERGGPDVQRRIAQGQRADIDRLIGTNANDRVGLSRAVKGEGDWNREKLAMTFGQQRVDPVFSRLDSEAAFANTNNRVIGNSATAERLPEEATPSFGIREAIMAGGPKSAAYAGAVRLAEKAVERIGGQRLAQTEADIARLLTSTERNQIMTALMKANGGKKVSPGDVSALMRVVLTAPGVAATVNYPSQ